MSDPGLHESTCRSFTHTQPPRARPRRRSNAERLARLLTWKRLAEAGWQQTGTAVADAADTIFRRCMEAGGAFVAPKGAIAAEAKVSISTIDNCRRLMEAHGLLLVRRQRIGPTRSRPNVWILTAKGRAIAEGALGVQRVTPTLCKGLIDKKSPTDSRPRARKDGRARAARGGRRASGTPPRKRAEAPPSKARPASAFRRSLEVSSGLDRISQRRRGPALLVTDAIRETARVILDIADPPDAPELAEIIRQRFIPDLSEKDLIRTLEVRGQAGFTALVYAAALKQSRGRKPVRRPAGLFMKVAWHTGQNPTQQLDAILAARRRVVEPAPLLVRRPDVTEIERDWAAVWIDSLPREERRRLKDAHWTDGRPDCRVRDWPVRAWRAAGRPRVQPSSPSSSTEPAGSATPSGEDTRCS